MSCDRNNALDTSGKNRQVPFDMVLSLDGNAQAYRLEFQSVREVKADEAWLEDGNLFCNPRTLEGYPYSYNGRTYWDIRSLWKETVEELSKTVYIGKDIYGEKVLLAHPTAPADGFSGARQDLPELTYLMYDGKIIHLVAMWGLGRIAELYFYDHLLSADARLKPILEGLDWPVDGIAWI